MNIDDLLALNRRRGASLVELDEGARQADQLLKEAELDLRRAQAVYRSGLLRPGVDPRDLAEARLAAERHLDRVRALADALDERLLRKAVAPLTSTERHRDQYARGAAEARSLLRRQKI